MTIVQYIERLNTRYRTGISTEHTYRGDLQNLLEALAPDVMVTNEPSRVACGAPDYILTKKNIPVGYIEAKDIGADLDNKAYKEQFDRYKASLHNLIITNYLDFRLYRDGVFVTSITIATIINGKIVGNSQKYGQFEDLIKDFITYAGQTIKSADKLARMMAGKARMLANVIENALVNDESTVDNVVYEAENTSLRDQLAAFKQVLIHDISPKEFADIYAQTIAYGMFAARLHDPTLEDFSRQEAAELIPKSNPFLRKLFQYVAGYDLDNRIKWIVDALADIFRATNVAELMKDFGKSTQQNDPVIHFYETFLGEYDPKLRKSRGVYYTPEPVVNFIVRAVDDILKAEFGLKDGLADISKTKVKVKIPTHDYRMKVEGQKGYMEVEQEVHKVQILDPAAGTGTFLAEIIKQIYRKFGGQQGVWSQYVEDHLIPRLNGFEILMASYAMAHLKLDLLLTETGYKPQKDQRFRVYLTNSLEEYHPDTGTLFAGWLSTEANEANYIKRDTPVMVVLGNPPYSGESQNKGEWIMSLMEDYKKEPGGIQKLKEQSSKFINDDYVKFIRYGQHFIEKNGEGILAFINNHGFLDNPTFRGMRWNILRTYDKIFVIDLHGNSKKKEISPDGSVDKNIFDIQPGVSINIFIKTGRKIQGSLGEVFHFEKYGTRESKYNFLWDFDLKTTDFSKVDLQAPQYFLIKKDNQNLDKYQCNFGLTELFLENSLGVLSKNDEITIDFEKSLLELRIEDFKFLNAYELRIKYKIKEDSRDWILEKAKQDLMNNDSAENYKCIVYRPFDNRWTYFTGTPKGFFAYSQNRIMCNLRNNDNYAIITGRQGQAVGQMQWNLSFMTKTISDQNIYYRGGGTVLPLYIQTDKTPQRSIYSTPSRQPNLSMDIVHKIASKIGLYFTSEKEKTPATFAPIDIQDYIYAVLHSPTYREKYKEFLKIDFPRIPYPKDADTFWRLVALGGELRQIHLLESPIVEKFITTYPQTGSNKVDKVRYDECKVWINDQQYFDGVPLVAWEFYIGGYQPAQKWLKDRKGRALSFEDILHYQKIIVALTETGRVMKEIDKISVE